MATKYEPPGRFGRAIHTLEETAIAVILGLMTLLTFVAVVLRYVFNSQLIWSLEVILILFSWLVILGVSYGFKVTAHLGVDALTNALPTRGKFVCGILASIVTLAYAILMMKGAWDYWAPFAGLSSTTGKWFPTGLASTRDQAWFETGQVPPMSWLFGWLEPLINQGESYSKLPVVVPYVVLPFGCALILLRVVQAFAAILNGSRQSLIVSHEAEEAVEEAAAAHRAGKDTSDIYEGVAPPAGRA
ncbi:MAG: TRAP transporter small permease [Jannaschia sp.]